MIKTFLEALINELGATGLLVVGLYFILYRPLNSMSYHIANINHELGMIAECVKKSDEKNHGKTQTPFT